MNFKTCDHCKGTGRVTGAYKAGPSGESGRAMYHLQTGKTWPEGKDLEVEFNCGECFGDGTLPIHESRHL